MQATDTMTIVIWWAEDAENKARHNIWQQIARDIELSPGKVIALYMAMQVMTDRCCSSCTSHHLVNLDDLEVIELSFHLHVLHLCTLEGIASIARVKVIMAPIQQCFHV